MQYNVLSIAGFDGSAGAGIQADIKTFSALGCYATTALTAIPVQNTTGVKKIYDIPLLCIEEQIKAILDDISIKAIKIGMLFKHEIIESVAKLLNHYKAKNIVLDPVMVAKSGDRLLLPNAIAAMRTHLFPITTVLTPNLLEASELLGRTVCKKEEMQRAALDLITLGPQAVIVKGGHLEGDCDDCLCIGNEIHWLSSSRIDTNNTHGTGCTFSAAIAAYLARGLPILDAVFQAKHYLTQAIQAGAPLRIGSGKGPLHHFYHLWKFLK